VLGDLGAGQHHGRRVHVAVMLHGVAATILKSLESNGKIL
jgi:hypothetical protein